MQDFKNLRVWEKAHKLTLTIYNKTKNFPKEETFGITSQLRRSSTSIPANLAEGCGKFNQKDIIRFFQIALGSTHETEYYLILSRDLNYIASEELNILVNEVKAMLISLIKKSKEKENANSL